MDKFRIDGHKLMYHVPRVYDWLRGKEIFPVYLELGLYGGCNLRCGFCAFSYLSYKPIPLDKLALKRFIKDAARLGVKSILFSGEGEPLLHKDIIEIISFTKKHGIDAALSTNGLLLDRNTAMKILPNLSWLRISVNAGRKRTYATIHKTGKNDFGKVLNNIKSAVKIRNKNKHNCAIGMQFLLFPENHRDAPVLARTARDLGVDYLVVKPYCRHPLAKGPQPPKRDLGRFGILEKRLSRYSTDDFTVVFRDSAMQKIGKIKPYGHCLGLSFHAHIASDGEVYPCNAFVGEKQYSYGSLYKHSFRKIWLGQKRKQVIGRIYSGWDINKCREACRLDEVNRYLWELKNPPLHLNFI